MTALKLAPECRADKWLDETIISCPAGDYVVLNESGSVIFEAATSGAENPEAAAAEALAENFGISNTRAKEEATSLIKKLRARGVLRSASPTQKSKKTYITRRTFTTGIAALGVSLLTPKLALGEEAAKVANAAYSPSPSNWVNKDNRIWRDAAGREVTIPETITRIAPYGPYAQTILEAICPEQVVNITPRGMGVSLLANENEIAELSASAESAVDISARALESQEPSIIIDIGASDVYIASEIDEIEQNGGTPTVHFSGALADLPQTLRSLGELLENDYASELADYVASILVTFAQGREQIDQLGITRSVYFGEGVDGLNTRAVGTLLSNVIELIGATSVSANLAANDCKSMDAALIEQWAPDVVVLTINQFQDGTDSSELIRSIWQETPLCGKYATLKSPNYPYFWLDKAPFVLQTLGALWLAHVTYPEVYTFNMAEVTADFFGKVFDFDLPVEDAQIILDESSQF